MIVYEYNLTVEEFKQENFGSMLNIARVYYTTIISMACLCLLINERASRLIWFMNILSLFLWFDSPYFRIVVFFLLVPSLEILNSISKSSESATTVGQTNYEKLFLANLFYMQALGIYIICYGNSQLMFNKRPVNRGIFFPVETYKYTTAFVLYLTKWQIQFIVLSFMNLRLFSNFKDFGAVGIEEKG